ncbi:VOC family protein [Draconibacterium halophilum]|uniref:Glyoxalase n=1 Tax=Draconibacterium halophilum TaxID=2706887 RepID=A0A6C0RI23_9BACT|nr:VOC family protein [Draconibacterium halophilum]QIA09779.1 glyoxalase [Draconibacterium halophilum]
MKVEHLAIWTYNLEGMRSFYMHYFDASSSEVYHNHSREYRSYFLSFDGDCRIELMEMPGIPKSRDNTLKQFTGLIHFAFKLGSKSKVHELTETLRKDGYKIISEPRTTGDGFFESVFLDPDGNRVEIMA